MPRAPPTVGEVISVRRSAPSVAVVSDGSGFHRSPQHRSVLTELVAAAEPLRDCAGVEATALLVTADSADMLAAQLRKLAAEFTGVYLVCTDDRQALDAQTALSRVLPVFTDQQTTAVAVTAAALTSLARCGTAPADGRVVIVEPQPNPFITACGTAAGIGGIGSWVPADRPSPQPSTGIDRDAVVIDLIGTDAAIAVRSVVTWDRTLPLLPLMGLLMAAEQGRRPDLGLLVTAARTLVERTPPGRVLPDLADHGLATAIRKAADRHPQNARDQATLRLLTNRTR